jgi:hypothetical protein
MSESQDQLSLLASLITAPTNPPASPTLTDPAPAHRPTRTNNRRRAKDLKALNAKLRDYNIKMVRDPKYKAWHEWKFEYAKLSKEEREEGVVPSKEEVDGVLAALGFEEAQEEDGEEGYEGDEESGGEAGGVRWEEDWDEDDGEGVVDPLTGEGVLFSDEESESRGPSRKRKRD